MYQVSIFAYEDCVATLTSIHGLCKTIKLAAKEAHHVPCAEVCIRRDDGFLAACLKNTWRGELEEVEVYSPISPLVTPLNPLWFTKER